MAEKYTAETSPYKTPANPKITKESDQKFSVGKADHASYTLDAAINEFAYGKDGGRAAALGNVPEVAFSNGSEVGALPKAFTGHFSVGDDKNVSTPVSGG